MMLSSIKKFLIAITLILSSLGVVMAQEGHEGHAAGHEPAKKEKFDVGGMIMHHIKDDHGWEFAHGLTLPLPVILYSQDRGLEVFSSAHLAHGEVYNGYKNEHGKIHRVTEAGAIDEEAKVYDFSITKNVASLLMSAVWCSPRAVEAGRSSGPRRCVARIRSRSTATASRSTVP